jgi:hypothetical protein
MRPACVVMALEASSGQDKPWKCRGVERVESHEAAFHPSHTPWKSLRDSHIPTATATAIVYLKTGRSAETVRTSKWVVVIDSGLAVLGAAWLF